MREYSSINYLLNKCKLIVLDKDDFQVVKDIVIEFTNAKHSHVSESAIDHLKEKLNSISPINVDKAKENIKELKEMLAAMSPPIQDLNYTAKLDIDKKS